MNIKPQRHICAINCVMGLDLFIYRLEYAFASKIFINKMDPTYFQFFLGQLLQVFSLVNFTNSFYCFLIIFILFIARYKWYIQFICCNFPILNKKRCILFFCYKFTINCLLCIWILILLTHNNSLKYLYKINNYINCPNVYARITSKRLPTTNSMTHFFPFVIV